MFLKILLTILFASQLSPALNTGGQILGWQTTVQEQQAGDSLISQTPQRINKNNLNFLTLILLNKLYHFFGASCWH